MAGIVTAAQGSQAIEASVKQTAAAIVCEKSHLSPFKQPFGVLWNGQAFFAFSAGVKRGEEGGVPFALPLALGLPFPFPRENRHLSPYSQVPAANFLHGKCFPSLSRNGPPGEAERVAGAADASFSFFGFLTFDFFS